MAFDLVATPGADNANSFADLDQADEYASFRVGAANDLPAWDDSDEEDQIRMLVTASRAINALNWELHVPGGPTSPTQALEWPRNGATTLPRKLVEATIELALSYLPALEGEDADAVDAVLNPAGTANIKREKTGPLETEYFTPTSDVLALSGFPPLVQRMLSSLIAIPSAARYGSGTARRAS